MDPHLAGYISQALEMIETTVATLQEELQELQELVTLLADLASNDSLGQEIDRATAAPPPPAPSALLSPVVSS
jgi:hypothetical protein